MANAFKKILAAGAMGGAGLGIFKLYQEYNMVKDVYNNVVAGTGEKLVYDEVFEGDSVGAFGAGVEIDMRDAEFEEDEMNLDLYGMCAGFQVMVPNDIQVVLNGVNRMSGVQSDLEEGAEGKVLNINYDLTMSGLNVVGVYVPHFDEDEAEDVVEEAAEAVEEAEEAVEEAAEAVETTIANAKEILSEAQATIREAAENAEEAAETLQQAKEDVPTWEDHES